MGVFYSSHINTVGAKLLCHITTFCLSSDTLLTMFYNKELARVICENWNISHRVTHSGKQILGDAIAIGYIEKKPQTKLLFKLERQSKFEMVIDIKKKYLS